MALTAGKRRTVPPSVPLPAGGRRAARGAAAPRDRGRRDPAAPAARAVRLRAGGDRRRRRGGSGRRPAVLLHDPAGHDAWQGNFRLVTLVRAELEPEMAADPLLPEVCWSWLTGALEARGLSYGEASGTVTRAGSHYFGGLSERPGHPDRDPRLLDAPRGPRRGARHRGRTWPPGATCCARSPACRRPRRRRRSAAWSPAPAPGPALRPPGGPAASVTASTRRPADGRGARRPARRPRAEAPGRSGRPPSPSTRPRPAPRLAGGSGVFAHTSRQRSRSALTIGTVRIALIVTH